ncbi:MAG: 2-amino-4-hydroxy-6-hydroxymethyldihydropteridine diphosphokinase [Bacteroidia bacterium]|nr:MAG: 2-amino-4-hydroxy-6-hydroxymethyldihydropteridine diphosphokinase [Bacteroidia bacterium]
MNNVYLGIGSNIYPRLFYIYSALNQIENKIGKIVQMSSVHQTEPWNMPANTPFFYNLCIHTKTNLSAEEILNTIFEIEKTLGRNKSYTRNTEYQSRTIDIDILLFNDAIITSEHLIIPHPHLHQRKFVLSPLAEIASNVQHPVLKTSIQNLLHNEICMY